MNIMIVGGTGLLGYHSVLAGIKRNHVLRALAVNDIDLSGWYPAQVPVIFGDVFTLHETELKALFEGCDALVYAVGPDDRVVPPAPAYDFFHERLVLACEKTVTAARKAGVKRCVILGSYFSYFDRLWPEKKLSERHAYIRCRKEQAQRAIAAGGEDMAVMVLELPYIFGSMPMRTPLWKDVLLDRIDKHRVVFFPRGGTNMIAASSVGEAVIAAAERGSHGMRYTVGDENHSFADMIAMMADAMGTPKKVVSIPRFAAVLAGGMIERKLRRQGLESGLDARYLMRDVLSANLYFDPQESAKALGYGRGGLKQAIEETVKACLPERFAR